MLAEGEPEAGDSMTSVALIMGAAAIALQGVLAGAAAKQGVAQWRASARDVSQLAKVHQVKTIVALAVCEGAAFVNFIFYGVFNPSPWLLAMGALLIAVNASKFPTVSGVADWCRSVAASA